MKKTKKSSVKKTSDGRRGGLLVGPTDKEGGRGIPATVIGGRNVILGGNEIIINENAALLHCEELDKINQSTGGRSIDCGLQKRSNTHTTMAGGGRAELEKYLNKSIVDDINSLSKDELLKRKQILTALYNVSKQKDTDEDGNSVRWANETHDLKYQISLINYNLDNFSDGGHLNSFQQLAERYNGGGKLSDSVSDIKDGEIRVFKENIKKLLSFVGEGMDIDFFPKQNEVNIVFTENAIGGINVGTWNKADSLLKNLEGKNGFSDYSINPSRNRITLVFENDGNEIGEY